MLGYVKNMTCKNLLKIKNGVFDRDYSYLPNMQSYSKREINNAGYIMNDNTKDERGRESSITSHRRF